MKKLLLLILCLSPLGTYATSTSLDDACKKYTGKYEESLTVPAASGSVNAYIKRGSMIYYILQDEPYASIHGQNISVRAYSCTTKTLEIAVENMVFQKLPERQFNIFTDVQLESVKWPHAAKWTIINIAVHAYGIGYSAEPDTIDQIGHIRISIDTKNKIVRMSRVFDYFPDARLGVIRY